MSEPLLTVRRRVAFSETDTAGIVHFSCFFRYFEDCEHELLRRLGVSVHEPTPDGGFVGFPRLEARANYLRPLRYPDVFDVEIRATARRTRSITWSFVVRRGDEVVATGETAVVRAQRVGAEGTLEAVSLPAPLAGVEVG